MIRIDGITKQFDTVKSLDAVSLIVENGSIFGLIGSNGSGKSTLLRILSGIYRQDEGDVTIDGEKVWENTAVKGRLVYLSDDPYFLPGGTPIDMMKLYKSVYPSFDEKGYRAALETFGLDEKRKLSTFSKGMQKQVSFLLGLYAKADVLLCDETLDGLDAVMRMKVRQMVASEVADRGMTVIFASHNLKEIEDICDHVALLHKGQLIMEAMLDDMKLSIHKVQLSFPKDRAEEVTEKLKALAPVTLEVRGSLYTLVVRGDEKELAEKLSAMEPVFMEFIPLTLEEIFVSEMEERGYDFHEEVLG